jgi:hypothetical protein
VNVVRPHQYSSFLGKHCHSLIALVGQTTKKIGPMDLYRMEMRMSHSTEESQTNATVPDAMVPIIRIILFLFALLITKFAKCAKKIVHNIISPIMKIIHKVVKRRFVQIVFVNQF